MGAEARRRLLRWIWTPGLPTGPSTHWRPPFGSTHIRAQTSWSGKAVRSQSEPPVEPTDHFPDQKASQDCFLSVMLSARLTVEARLHYSLLQRQWGENKTITELEKTYHGSLELCFSIFLKMFFGFFGQIKSEEAEWKQEGERREPDMQQRSSAGTEPAML